jgi:hypothetical protein
MPEYFGWLDDPEAVDIVTQELPIQSFGETEANEATDIPDKIMPWLLKSLPCRNQGQVGSCVSHGTARPIEYVHVMEINRGDKEQFKSLSRETIYGGSRVEVGGSKFKSDGSTGAWGSKFVNAYGTLFEEVYGKYDLTTYSVNRCKEWGATGVPNSLEPECAKYKVGTITKVTTAEQGLKAMASGYFINVCSNVGFELRRSSEGICRPSGVWNHSMSAIGAKKYKDSYLFCIENSWGLMTTKGDVVDLPHSGCWWIAMDVFDKMLKQGDSWAYSNYNGFPLQKLDWKF